MPYNENEYVNLNMCNFEIVKDCTYLGTIITNKNKLRPEIEKRITNANRAYYALLCLLKSHKILRAKKVKIYKILIRPMATYKAELKEGRTVKAQLIFCVMQTLLVS
jgi:hypothetical protein